MKRVLLDHCVPAPFRKCLVGHDVSITSEQGGETLSNGELLRTAEEAGFDVLITADKNLRYQQNLAGRRIAIIELPTNRLRLVNGLATDVLAALSTISPVDYVQITL